MTDRAGEETQRPADSEASVARWGWLIAAGIFASNLAQPDLLDLPLKQLLKNELKLGRDEVSLFLNLAAIPWYLKFVVGALSDSIPLFGTRRRSYLLIGASFCSLFWLLVGLVPHSYWPLLLALTATNAMLVIVSTVTAGLIVEAGKRFTAESRLVTVRVLVESFCALCAGPLAGYLTGLPFVWTGVVGATIMLSAIFAAIFLLNEPATAKYEASAFNVVWTKLRDFLRSRVVWSAALFLAVVNAPQAVLTSLYFHQTDSLNLSGLDIGYLNSIAGFGAIVATTIYASVREKFSLRMLLAAGIVCGAAGVSMYVFYRSHDAARVVEGAHGFLLAFGTLAMMELAVRATPLSAAAMGFAFFASAWNAGAWLGDYVGAFLVEHKYLSFYNLAMLFAGLTLLTLCALPLLPRTLFAPPDGGRIA